MMGAPKILSACAVPYQGLKHAGSSVHKCQRLILGCCHPTPGAIWSSFTVFDTRQISSCRPLINATKSAIKTAKIWPEEATLHLQDCFDQTHWDLFSQQAIHYRGGPRGIYSHCAFLHQYLYREHHSKQENKILPNQKPWMYRGTKSLKSMQ